MKKSVTMLGGMNEPAGRQRAIVKPSEAARKIEVRRYGPSAKWAPFIDYYWIVRWDLDDPHDQQVIPQPCIHLSAEAGRLLVNGVTREPFVRTLRGKGHVLGAAFHPAGFRPLLGSSVGVLTGRVVPAGEILGVDDMAAATRILDPGASDKAMIAALESYLGLLEVGDDETAHALSDLVALAEDDRTVTRADDLADRAGVSLRTLQRHFTEYIGIGPKWVIQRFRLLDAAAAAHDGEPTDWAGLAAELGFSDQAHLTRAFTSVVGTPPATYEREA